MFAVSIVLAIVIGYLFKGRLKNITGLNFEGIGFVVLGFIIEGVMKLFLAKGILEIGTVTFAINIVMYGAIMSFIFLNIKDRFILTTGIGFVLNIIVIFANNCTMPVGNKAAILLKFSGDISKLGLYSMVDSNTLFAFLADIIPYKIGPLNGIASVGDLFICIGLIGIIVREMRRNPALEYKKYELKY